MTIILLGINCILGMVMMLAIAMLYHRFNVIEKGVQAYLNPKVYASKSQTWFIESLVQKYEELDKKVDVIYLESMVKTHFNQQYIGRFSYLGVETMAIKTKYVMWGILFIQATNKMLWPLDLGTSHGIVMGVNTLLCMTVTISSLLIHVESRKKLLCLKLSDYLLHRYPLLKKQHTKAKSVQRQFEKEKTKQVVTEDTFTLNEQDIKCLLEQFNSHP